MGKKIYIIRHGETEYNKQGMVQGSGIDAPLNDTGRAQAAAFYNHYKDIVFDKIFVSRLQRTKETVQAFLENGIPHEVVEGLEEISWGNQEGVAFTPETSTIYQQTTKKWSEGDVTARIEGGENPHDVMKRQKMAMEYILKSDAKTILICTHGRAMRILLSWLMGHELSEMDQYSHTNTGLYVLDFEDEKFTIEIFNEVEHLDVLAR